MLELLLGISLGLAVLGMALSVWQTSQQSRLAFAAQQNLQHNARLAFEAILAQAELVGATTLDLSATDHAKGGDSLVLGHSRSVDPLDCQGNRNGTAMMIRNQFQRSTSTVNDFACKDLLAAGSTYQALAEGIEDFQIELAEVTPDAQKLQWKTPSQVTQWDHVVAIEVCLRLVSPQRVIAANRTNLGCQGESVPADGHLRWVQRRMVQVRRHAPFNRAFD